MRRVLGIVLIGWPFVLVLAGAIYAGQGEVLCGIGLALAVVLSIFAGLALVFSDD